MALTPVRRIRHAVMKDLGLPDDILTFHQLPDRFDCRETLRALKGSDIAVPPLDTAWRLWDYWERHLIRTSRSTAPSRARSPARSC